MLIMPIKSEQNIRPSNYDQLLELFQRWRDFEIPPMSSGAPDYTSKRFDERQKEKLITFSKATLEAHGVIENLINSVREIQFCGEKIYIISLYPYLITIL